MHQDEYTITTDESATFRQYSVTFAKERPESTPVEFSAAMISSILPKSRSQNWRKEN
jgi:hypothetical protein